MPFGIRLPGIRHEVLYHECAVAVFHDMLDHRCLIHFSVTSQNGYGRRNLQGHHQQQ